MKADSSLTQSGVFMGTPDYASPEQAVGRTRDVDARSDVFSLGSVLYEMLAGRPPFVASSTLETLNNVVKDDPAPPRLVNPRVPRDAEVICLKCLEKEPGRRYQAAEALAEDCRRFLAGEPISARPASVVYRVRKSLARHRGVAGVAAVAAVALLALAAWSYVRIVRERNVAVQERGRAENERREAERAREVAEMREREAEDARRDAEEARSAEEEQRRRAEAALEAERRLGQLDAELRVAGIVERALLPPRLPEIPGYAFTFFLNAPKEVTGGFYDFYERPDKAEIDIVLAAARPFPEGAIVYFGAQAEQLRGLPKEYDSPLPGVIVMSRVAGQLDIILGKGESSVRDSLVLLNKTIAWNIPHGFIVDLVLVRLDRTSNVARVCSCSFQPQVAVIRSNGDVSFLWRQEPKMVSWYKWICLPIGLDVMGMFERDIQVQEVEMHPGDALYLFTWRTISQLDRKEALFDRDRLDRLRRTLAEASGMDAEPMMDHVMGMLKETVGTEQMARDMCHIVLRRD